MKTIKKNILAGMGRAIGMLLVYGAIAAVLYSLGISINITHLPPTIEGEILQTLNK